MKKFKTEFLLLISALVFFILCNLVSKEIRYTFNIYDTYYVISGADFYKCFAILTLTIGMIYLVLDKTEVKLNKKLSKGHIFMTLLLISTLFFFNYKSNVSQTIVIGGDISNPINYGLFVRINLILIIFLQFFFLINIFVAQIKNLRNIAAK